MGKKQTLKQRLIDKMGELQQAGVTIGEADAHILPFLINLDNDIKEAYNRMTENMLPF